MAYIDEELQKATELLSKEQENEAIAVLNDVIERNPSNADAYLLRGKAEMELRRWREALNDFENVISINPSHADAHLQKGIVLTKAKMLDEAKLSLDKSIELQPGCAEAYYSRGQLFLDLRRYRESVQDLDEAVRLSPYFSEAMALKQAVIRLAERECVFLGDIDFTKHFNFSKLFETPISVFTVAETKYKCKWVEIHPLMVRSGGIAACDIYPTELIPLDVSIAGGTYPVRLLEASARSQALVACAAVILSDAVPSRWELVKFADGRDHYHTDVHGCFVDKTAVFDLDDVEEYLRKTENGCEWANINLGDVNLVLFEAGFTIDNTIAQYATYLGRDAANKSAVLLTDFWVLDWSKRKLAELY